ncbi:NADPH-dependent FMN reductase [Streptomyces gobiensis]|uniref:NADPH-dependent FMN reductase n=1 Tax=Streptomyces gobiensis TaxID=2875706 RepID=UPI001E2C749E|nr:NAD(P)H-dependent oxidoreductase [Streptomyces gobiensis]UGY92991.1 NAD(P)H-dependent oxidoreductase [Streptomyces gobiensis]
MSQQRLKVAVIIGSVRKGRFAETITGWFREQIAQRDDIEAELIDLADPLIVEELKLNFDETAAPMNGPGFAHRIGEADAFVIITPEYNHGYPASLKLAVDWVYEEWRAKPVAFISYGGMAGGQRAVEQLRQVFAELHAVTVRNTVSFHMAWEQFDEDGKPLQADAVNKAADELLDQLTWWGVALKEARAKRAYTA